MIKLTQKNFALKKILKFINTVLSQVKKIRNYIYYNSLNFSHLGENISFGKNLEVYGPKYISIGDNTYVGDYSIINAGKGGKIKIGKNCSVAANVKLINWYHDFKKMDISQFRQISIVNDININDDCWLGYNVTITSGVNLGRGCVVLPNSLVNSNFEDFSIIGGVPAKLISKREIK